MPKSLLPTGFEDTLFPEARKKTSILEKLTRQFESANYQQVESPMMEFENSLFSGTGAALKKQTFRLMDPVSNKMLGIRADITVQIERLVSTRLKNVPKPLRLSYAGQVLRLLFLLVKHLPTWFPLPYFRLMRLGILV